MDENRPISGSFQEALGSSDYHVSAHQVRSQHRRTERHATQMCNVWLTLQHGSGVNMERFGDSSGGVKELLA